MSGINTKYFTRCATIHKALTESSAVCETAKMLLELPHHQFCQYETLPGKAQSRGSGKSHSVAYVGQVGEAQTHVVLSVASHPIYQYSLNPDSGGREGLAKRITEFDRISRKYHVPAMCVVSIQTQGTSIAGLVLEDITNGEELEIQEGKNGVDGGFARVFKPEGYQIIFIDPDEFQVMRADPDVGNQYIDAFHIDLE